MEEHKSSDKPGLVKCTGQGFSILNTIEYKGRFLYSKYNPLKPIYSLIDSINILSGTLVVICSPGLWYGMDELLKKLPADCKCICIEVDKGLYELSLKNKISINYESDFFCLTGQKDYIILDEKIRALCSEGKIRRAVRIDFCSGTRLYEEKYSQLMFGVTGIIEGYWKNRVTLVKMGKLFSRNIIRNLKKFSCGINLVEIEKTISKPILVCGAGESLDEFLLQKTFSPENYYIVAVDAAILALLKRKIIPDAAVGVESQFAIQKAYIGTAGKIPFLFADLNSRAEIPELTCAKTIWFCSESSDSLFLQRLKKTGLIKEMIPAMGSVGLVAVYIACKIRSDENIPVIVSGLDFCFSAGLTHAKGTPASTQRLSESNRFESAENYGAAFSYSAEKCSDKSGNQVYSTPALESYANQFKIHFSGEKNIFSFGTKGLDLNLQNLDEKTLSNLTKYFSDRKQSNTETDSVFIQKKANKKNTEKLYSEEIKNLQTIRDLLRNGNNSVCRIEGISLDEQLDSLLMQSDYLWRHFPDGNFFRHETDFLKRIRAEIPYFLKQFSIAQK